LELEAFWKAKAWDADERQSYGEASWWCRWLAPNKDEIKLNFDGGVADGVAGCGFIIGNFLSLILCYKVVLTKNVIDAEVQVLWKRVMAVVKCYLDTRLWVEEDSAIIIESILQDTGQNPSVVSHFATMLRSY